MCEIICSGAEELSDDPLDIIIPVCIGVGGLLLLLTALAVCLLCWRYIIAPPVAPHLSNKLTLSLPNKFSSAKFLVCFKFQSGLILFKFCENVV